jgi:hypothetical protein
MDSRIDDLITFNVFLSRAQPELVPKESNLIYRVIAKGLFLQGDVEVDTRP